jgi:hypothetical protein
MPDMIAVIGPYGTDPASSRFLNGEGHGFVRQSMAKTPMTIQECCGRRFALSGKVHARDDKMFGVGLYVARKLHNPV